MGERIRDLSKVKIGNTEFEIELNKAYYENESYDIHLQCDKGRIGLSDRNFLKLAMCFMAAKKQFLQYKEMEENE